MRSPERAAWLRRLLVSLTVAALVGVLPGCGLFDSPVEVLLVGDSIMRQSGAFVEEALESRPDIDDAHVKNAAKNGSGLLTPDVYDWHAEAEEMIAEYDPEIVVVLFIGNYTDGEPYRLADGTPVEGYTPAFFEAWGREADRLMEILTAEGAQVWWVQPPPMIEGEGARRVREMRATYEALVQRWPGTGLIDGTAALAGPDGGYAAELPDADGVLRPVRTGDTVHLTEHGARILATTIADAIGPALAADQRARDDG